MADIKLEDLYLSKEELKDIIQLVAKKRNIKNYRNKSDNKLYKIFKKQSKNKKSINDIREELKDPTYNISRSESKDIKRTLYNIEKRNKVGSIKTKRYLDKLDQRILKLDKYHNYDDYEYKGIKDIEDLFKTLIDKDYYKPKLTKSGYKGNYVQYESKGDKILTLGKYFTIIEKYIRELIEEYKLKGEWNGKKTGIMHTKSDNIEITIGDDNDDIIEQLFRSSLQKYEESLQNKMRGSDFEFDGVNFLYNDFNKISLNRGGSYIESPKWLKELKSTINPENKDHKCFQYAVTLALNLDRIKRDHQTTSKIKPFIDQYNWKVIEFPAMSKDWKKFELNNEVALHILYVPNNTRKINAAYKSKNNLTCDKQVILLMITDGEKWHYLTVKNLPGLLRGITSTHKEDFYCSNCFQSYRTLNKLKVHKKICENHDYCHLEMPNKDNNIITICCLC